MPRGLSAIYHYFPPNTQAGTNPPDVHCIVAGVRYKVNERLKFCSVNA